MASFLQLQMEESPRYEGAPAVAPYRLATEKVYFPTTSGGFDPEPQHDDRADELRGAEGDPELLIETYEPEGGIEERCYLNNLTWLLALAGLQYVATPGGAAVTGPQQTTVVGVNGLNSAVVNVVSTAGWESTGSFVMGGVATTYTGKTATSFTGCGNHAATVGGEVVNDLVPAGVTKWVFSKRGGITAKTAQIIAQYEAEAVTLRGQGFGVSEIKLDAAGKLVADIMGLVVGNIAPSADVPVYDSAQIPAVRRGDLFLTWLAAGGTIEDFNLTLSNPLERVRSQSLETPSYFADLMEHGDEKVRLGGSIPKRRLADADIDATMAATPFAAKAQWRTPKNIGATSKKYLLHVDMPRCQLTKASIARLSNNRRHGGSYDWVARQDETLGYDFRVTLLNAVSSIETYV